MKITLFAAGSLGDILPCLRLGNGLQDAGFEVLLAAPQNFAGLVEGKNIPFHPLRGDVQQIMASETGRKFIETGGGNPIQSILAMRKMIGPVAIQMAEDVLAACQGADALITLAVFAPLGKTIAEIRDIPLILVEPTPLVPTGNFPSPGWPLQNDLGGMLNRFSGFGMLQVIWQWYRPFVNAFRSRFGRKPLCGGDFYRILTSVPLLGAYSPAVIHLPRDWPRNIHITGYWFQDDPEEWRPPAALEAFLADGPPPLYAGFGSMAGREPEHFGILLMEALARTGHRGILATGWGGMKVVKVPENIFVLDAAPHDWVFSRMAAVVHHGGAGTTAEGLRAGVPSVIVPFVVDQLFWGKRVRELGAGPEPIQAKRLTVEKLVRAIQEATTDPGIKHRSAAIGKAIHAEDGMGTAVTLVRQFLGVS